ncbi:DUF520 family protein [Pantoea ananatis]|nr:DUF520 family protein [Pantoea ananatis]
MPIHQACTSEPPPPSPFYDRQRTRPCDQARELSTRFDFKGVDAKSPGHPQSAPSDFQVKQMTDILRARLLARGIDVRCLERPTWPARGRKQGSQEDRGEAKLNGCTLLKKSDFELPLQFAAGDAAADDQDSSGVSGGECQSRPASRIFSASSAGALKHTSWLPGRLTRR